MLKLQRKSSTDEFKESLMYHFKRGNDRKPNYGSTSKYYVFVLWKSSLFNALEDKGFMGITKQKYRNGNGHFPKVHINYDMWLLLYDSI